MEGARRGLRGQQFANSEPHGPSPSPSPPPAPRPPQFLDRIKKAYDRNPALANLLVDPEFADEVNARQGAWRRVVALCVASGIACPSFSASLGYFDQYRRARLPANLTQAQRDFFGAQVRPTNTRPLHAPPNVPLTDPTPTPHCRHTYERTDKAGAYHTEWAK